MNRIAQGLFLPALFLLLARVDYVKASKCEPLSSVRQYEIGNFQRLKLISSRWAPRRHVVARYDTRQQLWNVERDCAEPMWRFFLTREGQKYYISYSQTSRYLRMMPRGDSNYESSFYAYLQPSGRFFLKAPNIENGFLTLDNASRLIMDYTDFPFNTSEWFIAESLNDLTQRIPVHVQIFMANSVKKWISSNAEEYDAILIAQDNDIQVWATYPEAGRLSFQAMVETSPSNLFVTYLSTVGDVEFQSSMYLISDREWVLMNSPHSHNGAVLIRTASSQAQLFIKVSVAGSDRLSLTPNISDATSFKIEITAIYHSVDIVFPRTDVLCEDVEHDEKEACTRRRFLKQRTSRGDPWGVIKTRNESYLCYPVAN